MFCNQPVHNGITNNQLKAGLGSGGGESRSFNLAFSSGLDEKQVQEH
jgi:hypothetical protein